MRYKLPYLEELECLTSIEVSTFSCFIIFYFTYITHKLQIFKLITFLCYYIYFSLLPYNVRITQLRPTLVTPVEPQCLHFFSFPSPFPSPPDAVNEHTCSFVTDKVIYPTYNRTRQFVPFHCF